MLERQMTIASCQITRLSDCRIAEMLPCWQPNYKFIIARLPNNCQNIAQLPKFPPVGGPNTRLSLPDCQIIAKILPDCRNPQIAQFSKSPDCSIARLSKCPPVGGLPLPALLCFHPAVSKRQRRGEEQQHRKVYRRDLRDFTRSV